MIVSLTEGALRENVSWTSSDFFVHLQSTNETRTGPELHTERARLQFAI